MIKFNRRYNKELERTMYSITLLWLFKVTIGVSWFIANSITLYFDIGKLSLQFTMAWFKDRKSILWSTGEKVDA